MIKATLGDHIDGWIHTLFPFLFNRRLNPDALTLVGVGISSMAAVAFAIGAFVPAGLLILAGGFFDLVDGVVARHQGSSTAFGAFLDSTMDRLVDMLVLFGLIVHYAQTDQMWMLLATGAVLIMSVITSYSKARAEQLIDKLEGGFLERGERVGLLAGGAILGWMEPVMGILLLGTTATVIQRIWLARKLLADLPPTGAVVRAVGLRDAAPVDEAPSGTDEPELKRAAGGGVGGVSGMGMGER